VTAGEPLIHPAAPVSRLSNEELRLQPDARGAVVVDPERAGWRYLSFLLRSLGPGARLNAGGEDREATVVLLSGQIEVDAGSAASPVSLARSSVFEELPSAVYLPPGLGAVVAGAGRGSSTVAIAEAPASGRAGVSEAAIVIRPGDVRVEIRGSGNATRQINHIVAPEFPADRLEVVEVLTPSGNWSSWPPHKHDIDDMPTEAVLEEIYCYQFRRPEAWAIQRLYRRDRSRDASWEVRSGEVVIVTDGYHPFVAAHGDDAYYLNALAGDRRTMACSFDPDLDWVRATWADAARDPRVPLVPPAAGRVDRAAL
jgi:5-deoxy-glucuronate isomerase